MKGNGKWIILAIVAMVGLGTCSSYNGLVTLDQNVKGSWSEYQNQLKRRSDLIPNLVTTVKGYAEHERGIFDEVAEARAKVSQVVSIDPSKLANDPLLQKQMMEMQKGLNASLGRLIAIAENYPQLKADKNFLRLQDELSGTENRVAVARGRAIKTTQEYNTSVLHAPTSVVARLGGFAVREYYAAAESEQAVPVVDFGKR